MSIASETPVSYQRLIGIRDRIEQMSVQQHIQILSMLVDKCEDKSLLNSNMYGTHVNLCELPVDVLLSLEKFIEFTERITAELNRDRKSTRLNSSHT